MSQNLFLMIFERALSLDDAFPLDMERRWIKRLSVADANLMSQADISSLKLSMINSAALIAHNGQLFFGVSGFPEPAELPPNLSPADATPGLFGCFCDAVALESNASAAQILDAVVGYNSSDPTYQGHDLESIMQLFPKIQFYEVDQGYVFSNSLERLLGSYVARGYSGGPLRIGSECLDAFSGLFEHASDRIPYGLPLRGVVSFTWAAMYLELYRCIEQLYAVPKVTKIRPHWNAEASIYDVAKILEEVTGWRPKEDDSLEALFRQIDIDTCASLCKIFYPNEQRPEDPVTGAARAVYKLRNACVHFRPTTQLADLNDTRWNHVISLIIRAIEVLYDKFGDLYFSGAASTVAE